MQAIQIGQQRTALIRQIEGNAPQNTSSKCLTTAKLKRLAHYFFATLLYSGAVLLAGAALTGAISGWYLLAALFSLALGNYQIREGKKIVDPSNAKEMQRVRAEAAYLPFLRLANKFKGGLVTILACNVVSREQLTQKFLRSLISNYLDTRPFARFMFENGLIHRNLLEAINASRINETFQLAEQGLAH